MGRRRDMEPNDIVQLSYPSGGGRLTRFAEFGQAPDLMAGSKFRSQVEVLSVVDKGRRREWSDAEKVRIVTLPPQLNPF